MNSDFFKKARLELRIEAQQDVALTSQTLLDREYSVLPAVMMRHGAYFPNISSGEFSPGVSQERLALFFSGEDLERSVNTWNGRPVSLNHPEDSVSCNTPDNYSKQWLGYVFNARYDDVDKALKSEIWVEKQRGEVVINKLQNGDKIDVSIGAFGEIIDENGEVNDVTYNHRFTNIVGDHLAVLPYSTGACSWDKGCGIRAEEPETSRGTELHGGDSAGAFGGKVFIFEDKESTAESGKQTRSSVSGSALSDSDEARNSAMTIAKKMFEKEFGMDKANASENVEAVVDAKSCVQSEVKPDKAPMSINDFLAGAPSEIRATLTDAVNSRNVQREAYVNSINQCKHDGIKFCSKELEKASTETLMAIAALVAKASEAGEKQVADKGVKAANYLMQGNAESKAVGYMEPAKIDWAN